MGKLITGIDYVWGSILPVLFLNIVATIPFQPSSVIYQICMKTLTLVILFMEATNYMASFIPSSTGQFNSDYSNLNRIIMVLFFLVFFFLDIFFSNSNQSKDHASEGEDDSGNHNEQQSQKPNKCNFILLLFAVLMWLSYMLEAIAEFTVAKPLAEVIISDCVDRYDGYGNWHTSKYCYHHGWFSEFFNSLMVHALPMVFFHIFHFPLMQKVYAHFFLSAGIPRWTYFLYMIPQAILWPLSAVIAFYVQQEDFENIFLSFAAVRNMFSGALFYVSFKLLFEFVEEFKKDKNENHKKLRLIFLVVGFLLYYFIYQIGRISDLHYYDITKDQMYIYGK